MPGVAAPLPESEPESPPPAISRMRPPISAIATSTMPMATLRLPHISVGRTRVARRDGGLFGRSSIRDWLPAGPDRGRDEAGRPLAPGSVVPLRRREGGRLVASPPARPPLDGLAMTASCRRGQDEAAEDQRASDQTQGQQVGAG